MPQKLILPHGGGAPIKASDLNKPPAKKPAPKAPKKSLLAKLGLVSDKPKVRRADTSVGSLRVL